MYVLAVLRGASAYGDILSRVIGAHRWTNVRRNERGKGDKGNEKEGDEGSRFSSARASFLFRRAETRRLPFSR